MFKRTRATGVIIAAVALLLAGTAVAEESPAAGQEDPPREESEQRPPPARSRLDGFGGPMAHLSRVRGDLGFFFGGRGEGNVTDHFTLGGGGCGLVNFIRVPDPATSTRTYLMKLGYGGLELGYVFNPQDAVRVSANLLSGAGLVIRKVEESNSVQPGADFYWFFALEPAVYLNVDVLPFMQVNLGVKYRQLAGLDADWVSQRDLNGFSASVALLFGRKPPASSPRGGAEQGH